ncbi:MAG: hypothetical protein AAF579_18420 [Cyanobacteria bacterium P01_C01_bin.118]
MRDQVLEAIDHAVLCSVPMLAIMSNAEPAIGYALCTDNDLGGIYVAGYTASDASMFREDNYRYRPAEWPMEYLIQEASHLLNEWVYLQSLNDAKGLEPGDDHLRPWKADVFEDIVSILEKNRAAGTFNDDMTVLFISHDPSPWMADKINDAIRRLNSPEVYDEWKREIYDGWIEAQLQWQEFQAKRPKNIIKRYFGNFWSSIRRMHSNRTLP